MNWTKLKKLREEIKNEWIKLIRMKGARTEDQIYGEFGEDSGSYENEESEKDDDLEPTPNN